MERPAPILPIALGGMAALALAMGIGRFAYTPILPSMLRADALDIDAAGFVAAANFAGYLIGAIAAARIGAALRRPVLATAIALSVATTAGMALPETMPGFLLLRFASGLASAFVLILAASLTGAAFVAAGWRAGQAVVFTGVGVGICASALIVTRLGGSTDWRGLWLASAAAALLAGLVALWGLQAAKEGGAAGGAAPAAPESRRFWAILSAYGLFGFGYVVHATYLPAMVASEANLAPFAPYTWLAVGLAAAPSPLLWSALARRLTLDRALALALLVETLGVAAPAAFGITMVSVLAAGIGLGGTFVGITVLALQRGVEVSPHARTATTAVLTAAFGAGQALGPAIAGVLVARSGAFDGATWLAAGLLAVATLLVAVSPRRPSVGGDRAPIP